MARPYQTRASQRVPVSIANEQQPGLDVPAQLDVRTPDGSGSALAGLAQVLNLFGAAGQQYAQERNAQDVKQGAADAELGKVDEQYAKHHWQYANAAFETTTLEQYHAAEERVTKKASDELDHSLPMDEQVHTIDGWMKTELAPLIQDPRARRIIGERYQAFIQTAAGNIQKAQLEAHAQEAQDAVTQDATVELQRTGGLSWDQHFHRLYTMTGDASRANGLLVGVVAQGIEDAAARGEDYSKLKDLIPSQVVGPDGAKLPGPMYSPKYRGIIAQAMANAEHMHDRFYEEQGAQTDYKNFVGLDQDLANGVPITMDTLAAKGIKVGTKPGEMSASTAANYIQASQQSILKAQAAQQKAAEYDNGRAMMGRWADVRSAVPDYSEEKRNDAADAWFQRTLVGGGAKMEQLGGADLVKDPNLVAAVARLSAQEGVPYRPLKDTMSSINPAAPGDVVGRLDAYRQLKARNLAGMYVDDQSALVYEAAIAAQQAGEKPEGVAEVVRNMGDPDKAAYVGENIRSIDIDKKGAQIAVPRDGLLSIFGDTSINSNNALNAAQINGRLKMLTTQALVKGLPVAAAQKYAADRLAQTSTPLKVNGQWVIVPNESVPNVKATESALDWYTGALPALSKKLGIPPDEPLQVMPTYGLGKKLEFQVTRAGGVEIPHTRFTLDGLLEAFYKAHPEATPQGQAQQTHLDAQAASKPGTPLPMMQRH
jgi:hypothetical protein